MKSDKIISVLFHPVFMPVYGLALILSANTPFGYLPYQVKRLLFLIIVVNNVFLPISLLPILRHMNFISSWSMNEKEERMVPLIVVTILYAVTSFIIFRFPVPGFLKVFFISVFLVSLILTMINFRWKISLHSTGMGAMIALIMFLSFRMYSPLFWYLVFAVFAGGLVLSSRLRLMIHSPRQVWYGCSLGFVSTTFFLIFFQQFV
ncbi:MAG TPA: hypothetical protein VK207_03465 [Bacteroidales bacterium]|nr:hypothetical protein [Bacteroidales bacterium]